MALIDQQYQQQLSAMHQDGKFNNGAKAYKLVKNFISEYQPISLLDFGCGQGGLISTIKNFHPEIAVSGYDPGNQNFNKLPSSTFDAVVSTDAIEHIEPAFLNPTLTKINELMQRCGFFRIACYPAKKSLPDGRNAHLIVETPEWWRNKILNTMNVEIVWDNATVFDKTEKWPWVKGHNYDLIVVKK